MIASLCPRSYEKYLALPIIGSFLNEFIAWCHSRGFTTRTMQSKIEHARPIDDYFQQTGFQRLEDLTQKAIETAWQHYRPLHPSTAGTIRLMACFLAEHGRLGPPVAQPKTAIDTELDLFSDHLRCVRGLEPSTIRSHGAYLREFLAGIGYLDNAGALATLTMGAIESFIQRCATRLNRYSLRHVIGYLRAFLRFQYEKSVLSRPLHTMIDTPRIYRLERLPRHLPWETVKQFLSSIDTSNPHGLRDYTMFFLVATYGLRSCEVVSLTLDDIDWRAGTVRIAQRKTAQELVLPLTDAAGDVLVRYVKESRPKLPYRQLFLRVRAPHGALERSAVWGAFRLRVRLSGLDIPNKGSHALRHSYATHLLRQGASVKAIGDLLGHRNAESTCIYLRLATEQLRTVALPVPEEFKWEAPITIDPVKPNWKRRKPKEAQAERPSRTPTFLSSEIEEYLGVKRSLGRRYSLETDILNGFDTFIGEYYPSFQDLNGEMFNAWAATMKRLSPTVRRNYMRMVRNFCLYRQRSRPESFVPDPSSFPPPHQSLRPYIFSESEIARLLEAARYLRPHGNSPLRSESLRLAILLLFTAGLRRGELLRLTLRDFTSQDATVHIRATKFHKSRIVPLSSSVCAEVEAYLALRNERRLPMEASSALIWNQLGGQEGRGYTGTGLANNWRVLCTALELFTDKGKPPRIHDLRHSFAVTALKRCYIRSEDVQARLPILSTYMGHVSIVSTHYYLSFVEQIRSAASDRFHEHFGRLLFDDMANVQKSSAVLNGGMK